MESVRNAMKKKKETSPSECLDGFFFAQIMEKDWLFVNKD